MGFQDLINLLLPFIAGALLLGTARLASLTPFAAAALCLFSLVEPSVITAGRDLPQQKQKKPGVQLLHSDHTPGVAYWGATYACAEQGPVSCEPGIREMLKES